MALEPDDEKQIRGFRFLTQKPVLVLLNVGERDLGGAPALVESIAAGYPHQQALIDALSARIEMELGELEPDEAAVFMEELGIAESGLDRVIALSYRLLGLVSFLTAGPDEVRAWPIPDGSSAVDAAGAIHSDLAKGFIRAETVAYDDLLELGSMAEARQARPAPLEGKTYQVRDGDVIEILFGANSGGALLVRARAPVDVEVRADRHVVGVGPAVSVSVVLVIVLVVEVAVDLGQEVVVFLFRDVDRGAQPVVGDVQEAVLALEHGRDRLDQRVLRVTVLDPAADRLDEVEELVGLPL